jgi:hypothetical protein
MMKGLIALVAVAVLLLLIADPSLVALFAQPLRSGEQNYCAAER